MSSAKAILKSLRIKIFHPQLPCRKQDVASIDFDHLGTGILNLHELDFLLRAGSKKIDNEKLYKLRDFIKISLNISVINFLYRYENE